jgi:glycosyltransferase involved in cell wall biosynthesis
VNRHHLGERARRILPLVGAFPRGGTLVFVGTWRIGPWVHLSRAARIVVVHNSFHADVLHRRLRGLRSPLLPAPELVFCSPRVARHAGLRGVVHLSPIDLARFRPARRDPPRSFTVGRMSRDDAAKFGAGDAQLFRQLGAEGVRVRLMGATHLRELAGAPGVEVLPFGSEDPAAFLRSLDCFVYRTAASWPEPHGRVVSEAMACGLPVVCHRNGGYAGFLIDEGRTGFLYDDDAQAQSIVRALRADPALRARVGDAGRRRVEELLGPEGVAAIRRYYLGQGGLEVVDWGAAGLERERTA